MSTLKCENLLDLAGVAHSAGGGGAIVTTASQATTSGTEFDFTAIPATASRVTVMLLGVSLSDDDEVIIQLGTSGGFATTGYTSRSSQGSTSNESSAGMIVNATANASSATTGSVKLRLAGGTTWIADGTSIHDGGGVARVCAGSLDLGGVLTQVRVTRTGTNTFDAGSVSLTHE